MTDTPFKMPTTGPGDRNMALVNYGLLFASIFFVGVPGLIAVIIAYSQRDAVTGVVRRHYDSQIRIFWVAFALGILGTITGVWGGLMGVSQLITFGADHMDAWEGLAFDDSDVHINVTVVGLLSVTVVSWLLMTIWLLAAPAIGFIRLASERVIGDGAA
jgi:uncharacterized membrane protein